MKKIIAFLMALALGLTATASAQKSASCGTPTKDGKSEIDCYTMKTGGLYSWALKNDPKLAVQLNLLFRLTLYVNEAAPGSYMTPEVCAVLMPLFDSNIREHKNLVNEFDSLYRHKFPQLVEDLQYTNKLFSIMSSKCRKGINYDDEVLLNLFIKTVQFKIYYYY